MGRQGRRWTGERFACLFGLYLIHYLLAYLSCQVVASLYVSFSFAHFLFVCLFLFIICLLGSSFFLFLPAFVDVNSLAVFLKDNEFN